MLTCLVVVPLARASDTLWVAQIDQKIALLAPYAQYAAASQPLTLAQARQLASWRPVQAGTRTREDSVYWVRARVCNDQPQAEQLLLNLRDNERVEAYALTDQGTHHYRGGIYLPRSQRSLPDHNNDLSIRLEAGQCAELWVQVAKFRSLWPDPTPLAPLSNRYPKVNLTLWRQAEATLKHQTWYEEGRLAETFKQHFQGSMVTFAFLVLVFWAATRQLVYVYYGLYLMGFCLYSFLNSRPYTNVGHLLDEFPFWRNYLIEPAQWLGLSAYCFFVVALLDLPANHPRPARLLRGMGHVFWAASVGFAALAILTNDREIKEVFFVGSRALALPLNLVALFWVWKSVKHPLTPFFLIGNVIMAVAGIGATLMSLGLWGFGWFKGSLWAGIFYEFGIGFEVAMFSLALAYRQKLLEQARLAAQQAYIGQLETNNRLSDQVNRDLAQKVHEATREVLNAQRLLEVQREHQLHATYAKRLAETEMLALRSQMNPHFLFNSLNSIEYFILSGHEEKAAHYLTRFSRLLRMILQHSRAETISLGEELAALGLYLELEASRFEGNFQFDIAVDQGVDQENTLLPPLLLQPFVENAIWHGLMPSELPQKQLWVRIKQMEGQSLALEVEDNGIGRARSGELKRRSAISRQSFGVAITNERIKLFNRNYAQQLQLQITDLPRGTRVQLLYHPQNQFIAL